MRKTFVFINFAELLPVPSESRTMFFDTTTSRLTDRAHSTRCS